LPLPPSLPPSLSNYLGEANANIATLAMIETKEAIDNLDEICAVEGLDGVFIGRSFPSLPPSLPPSFATLAMIDTKEAMDNLEEIYAVEA